MQERTYDKDLLANWARKRRCFLSNPHRHGLNGDSSFLTTAATPRGMAAPLSNREVLAPGPRDYFTKQLPGVAVEFLQLHLLDWREVVGAGRDSDAG
jgi:hypothetical protein